MNAARRSIKRRDWPRGLREPRPGYFAWEHPDGRILPIGRVPLAVAKSEATAANLYIAEHRTTLVDRLAGASQTVADLLDKMPEPANRNTRKSTKTLDSKIRAKLGDIHCAALRVRDVAELLEEVKEAGKARTAEALRSRLLAVCRKGQALGWMESNPAEITDRPKVAVKRGRLTLEQFRAILEHATKAAGWLPRAMLLGLLTGADRSTLVGLRRADVADGWLTITRPKTGARVAIPTSIRLEVVGMSLAEVLAQRTGVVSPWLIHHVTPYGNAPAGSPVFADTVSKAFTRAREMAGIPDEAAPTFHELRSLAKRLYREQGGVDTKALLGHKTERMSDLYANPRGVEPIRVKVG
jgi:integrase